MHQLVVKRFQIDKALTYASETRTLTKGNRNQLNVFERKVYRRILGPVYDNEKENWRILTHKEILKTYYNRDSRGKLSYLAPLGSESISAPYFKQCFLQGGLPPRLSLKNILFYILNFASIIKFKM